MLGIHIGHNSTKKIAAMWSRSSSTGSGSHLRVRSSATSWRSRSLSRLMTRISTPGDMAPSSQSQLHATEPVLGVWLWVAVRAALTPQTFIGCDTTSQLLAVTTGAVLHLSDRAPCSASSTAFHRLTLRAVPPSRTRSFFGRRLLRPKGNAVAFLHL